MLEIKDTVRSWLENSLDFSERELIRDLVNLFNLSHDTARVTYKAWKMQYMSDGYTTIENSLKNEHRMIVRGLDKGHEEYIKRTGVFRKG